MTPEVWEAVARELNTAKQLARNWLPQAQAEKIIRHLRETRRLIRGGEPPPKSERSDPAARDALRLCVFAAYGGRCACCGEAHPRVLTIDHVEPRRGRKRPKDIYRRVLAEGCPPAYQVLCLNCNQLKGTGEACPHGRSVAA